MKKTLNLVCLAILILASKVTLAQCVVAYYPFDGNGNDTSANGFHATVNGATLTTDRFGAPNSAYQFDGINDFLDAGNVISPAQAGAITISAWVNTTSLTGSSNFCGVSIGTKTSGELMVRVLSSSNPRYQAAIAAGTASSANGSSSYMNSDSYISLNEWHHVVGVFTNYSANLWVDGVLQSQPSSNLGGAPLSTISSLANLWIGKALNTSNTKYFKGKIDDVLILQCAADSAMIQDLYNAPGPTKSCVILGYPFDGNANDTSSNSLNATVHGATLTSDRFGNPASAYEFDGVDDYLDAGNIVDLSQESELTISAWINPKSLANGNDFSGLSIGTKTAGELMIRVLSGSNPKFQAAIASGTQSSWNGSSSYMNGDSNINLDTWYHVVGVFSDYKAELWIDGVLQSQASSNLGGAPLKSIPSSSSFWIGKALNTSATKYFQGKIDDVLILRCAADSAMIQTLYSVQIGVAEHAITQENIEIYPNPTTGLLNIELESGEYIEEVIIYNQLGQAVSQVITTSNTSAMQVEISHLPAGIYLVKTASSTGVLTKRVIKK